VGLGGTGILGRKGVGSFLIDETGHAFSSLQRQGGQLLNTASVEWKVGGRKAKLEGVPEQLKE